KTRNFLGSIDTVGLKVELSLRFNLIFFVGTDFDFYESDKVIQLGTGIEIGAISLMEWFVGGLGPEYSDEAKNRINRARRNLGLDIQLTGLRRTIGNAVDLFVSYIPFKNTSGAMVIVTPTIGFLPAGVFSI